MEYYVQVGSWRNIEYAEDMREKLTSHYPEVFIIESNNFHKVRIPQITTEKQGTIISNNLMSKFDIRPMLVQKTR